MKHIPMPQNFVEATKHAQSKCALNKKLGTTITCPFLWSVDEYGPTMICEVCHTWMQTDKDKYSHPCNILSYEEIKLRFWRNVIPV